MAKVVYKPNMYSQQRQRQKPVWVYPVLMAMEAQYHREHGDEVYWDEEVKDAKVITEPEGIDFLKLPIPDRVFSHAFDKRYQVYGNYKYHPATHMQVADGCWHGKCTFCVENGKRYKVRSLKTVMEELEICQGQGFKEVFDDSGTFPDGKWLVDFCTWKWINCIDLMMGCNMRIGADVDFGLMKRANFRMILFGIESANQSTLDRLNKGIKADDIIPTLKRAKEAGLESHIAFMTGYPWEDYEDEKRTINLCHYLLKKGYVSTAQVSVYSAPRTCPAKDSKGNALLQEFYNVYKNPQFLFRKIQAVKNWADFAYLFRGARLVMEERCLNK